MRRQRLVIGAAGIVLGMFGAFRLVTDLKIEDLTSLAIWLLAVVLIHDGIVAPLTVAMGVTVSRLVPARGRRYVQAALTIGALTTVVALPLIYRQDSQPPSKAILQQNYLGNLALLLGLIATASAIGYALRVVRNRTSLEAGIPE